MITQARVIGKTQGFYEVMYNNQIIQLRLKGTLKKSNNKLNCVIGDIVDIDTDENLIVRVLERKNLIQRPLIANIDNIVIFWSLKDPIFDIITFQKKLLNYDYQGLKIILVINKIDLVSDYVDKINELKQIFKNIEIFALSLKDNIGVDNLKEYMYNKTTVLAGVSGVGKSSFINHLMQQNITITGQISAKTKKGKNTTIVTKYYEKNNYRIFDTPGFSSVSLPEFDDDRDIMLYFSEFKQYLGMCKFNDCLHINEPNCQIKAQVEKGNINKIRYEFYKSVVERKFL